VLQVPPQYTGTDIENEIRQQLTDGALGFNVPQQMQIGVDETVEARILKKFTTGVVQGLVGRGVSELDAIAVANRMSVRLQSNAFDIRPMNYETQLVTADVAGDWEWTVTPKKAGNHVLDLTVWAQVEHQGEPLNIRTFHKPIQVAVNHVLSVSQFFGDNWQTLFTVLTVPVVTGLVTWWRARGRRRGGSRRPSTSHTRGHQSAIRQSGHRRTRY
jgi:hypothetical protein